MSDYQQNIERAERAGNVLDAYGDPGEPNLRDLLTDLMHYADKTSIDFTNELEAARMHFEAETEIARFSNR